MNDETIEQPDTEQQTFLFDDFFVSEDDPGIEVTISVRGQLLPFRLRSRMSLGEKQEAMQAAIRKQYLPNGQVKILGVDEKRATLEVLVRAIRSWPFKYRDGKPVPITRETVAKLDAEIADELSNHLQIGEQAKAAALVPFESNSGAA